MPVVALLSEVGVAVASPLFLVATGVVAVVAPRLTATAKVLGKRTGLGKTLAGVVLLGASTSLPGIIVTVVATLRGDVALAVANAVGGVAAQTVFLAVADVGRRKGALFQEAVSAKALTQLGVLLVLLALPLFAIAGWPDTVVGRIHPASAILVVAYVAGLWAARREPGEAEADPDDKGGGEDLSKVWARYAIYVGSVGVAGFVIGTAISPIAQALGLTSVAAGALITAGATSSPELVTAVTAARRQQLHLAVGDIIGGNTFDVLFLVLADLALAASLFSELGVDVVVLLAAAILLNAILLLGFVRRRGAGAVSPESVLMFIVYVALALVLLLAAPDQASVT